MNAITLRDIKNVVDLSNSNNFCKRIEAAKSQLASKKLLRKLAKDKYWLVRFYVTMNENVTQEILEEMKKEEKDLLVFSQIVSELNYRKKLNEIRGIKV